MWMSRFGKCAVGVCVCVLSTGCMPKMTIEEMKAMMPERPAALDKLNMMVGTWAHEGTARFAAMDEPLKMTARTTAKMAGNGWYLVESGTYSMPGFDDMYGMTIWTYDMGRERFRVTWVDTMGSQAHGTATYDEDDNEWKMRIENDTPFGTSTAYATVQMIDEDTQKWTWTESAFFGLIKIMDMDATVKRQ